MEQFLTTFINHAKRLIPDVIHHHESMGEKNTRFALLLLSAGQWSSLVPFYTSLVRLGRGSNLRLPALETDTVPLSCQRGPFLQVMCILARQITKLGNRDSFLNYDLSFPFFHSEKNKRISKSVIFF